ncbi:MAG: hypothetical protein LBH25_09635 [Fibromonadaceae bacterium]|jgi:hypothetical protein|nr:hypothetical protein [Fibromonadaceae bacterium]
MKVSVEFDLLKAYLPERELVKITDDLNASRENHRLYMRKKRENHKADVKITNPKSCEIGSKTAFSGKNPIALACAGGVGGDYLKDILSIKKEFNLKDRSIAGNEIKNVEDYSSREKLLAFLYSESKGYDLIVFRNWWQYGESRDWKFKSGAKITDLARSLDGYARYAFRKRGQK